MNHSISFTACLRINCSLKGEGAEDRVRAVGVSGLEFLDHRVGHYATVGFIERADKMLYPADFRFSVE
jgi:hypothetical protein